MYYNAFLNPSTRLKLGKFDSQKQATKTLIFTNNKCHYLSIIEVRWHSSKASDPEREVVGLDPHSGRPIVSLSIYLPKSTGNTQEAVAPS